MTRGLASYPQQHTLHVLWGDIEGHRDLHVPCHCEGLVPLLCPPFPCFRLASLESENLCSLFVCTHAFPFVQEEVTFFLLFERVHPFFHTKSSVLVPSVTIGDLTPSGTNCKGTADLSRVAAASTEAPTSRYPDSTAPRIIHFIDSPSTQGPA